MGPPRPWRQFRAMATLDQTAVAVAVAQYAISRARPLQLCLGATRLPAHCQNELPARASSRQKYLIIFERLLAFYPNPFRDYPSRNAAPILVAPKISRLWSGFGQLQRLFGGPVWLGVCVCVYVMRDSIICKKCACFLGSDKRAVSTHTHWPASSHPATNQLFHLAPASHRAAACCIAYGASVCWNH